MILNFLKNPMFAVPQPPGGGHTIFNGTLRDGLNMRDFTNRVTSYPITSHGGAVMSAPGYL
jgi:hypothetical protein